MTEAWEKYHTVTGKYPDEEEPMNETADELLRAVVAIAQLPMERWAGAFLFIIGELRAIAAACGVTEKTGYRWLHEMRDELCQRQDTALSAATGQLAAAVTDAVTLLRNMMDDAGLPASARVRAAIGVLDAALRYVELHDILRRIAALEQIYRERSEEGCPAWSVELQSWRK